MVSREIKVYHRKNKMKGEKMKEEIYAFYSLLRQNERHSKEYVLICTFKTTVGLWPDMTLEEFNLMIKDFTKRFREEKEIN